MSAPRPLDPLAQALFSAMDQPVVLCGADGRVQAANTSAEALARAIGRELPKPGAPLSDWWRLAGAGDSPAAVPPRDDDATPSGQPMEHEVRVRDVLDSWRTVLLRWQPVVAADGTVGGFVVTLADVTLRGAVEETLAVLQRALDAITEGVLIADLEQRAVYYNRAYERLSGGGDARSIARLLGDNALSRVVHRRLETAQPFAGQFETVHPDGRRTWNEVAIIPLRDDAGDVTHYLEVREDITARKLIERSLEESRSRLQAVITTAMDGIISFDEQQEIVLINHAAATMFGLREQEAMGRSIQQLIPGLFDAVQVEPLRALGGTADPSAVMGRLGEIQGRRAGGEEFPIEVSISQVQVHGRQLFTVILRDISARREAERVLQASEHRFKSIFEHSIDGILLADDEGNYVDANPAACRLLGYSRDELVRRHVSEIAVLPDPPGGEAHWRQFLQQGSARGELQLRQKGDTQVLVEYSAIGNILPGLHLAILRDVTERQAMHEQLLRQQRLDSVGRLASGLAHDLNNILTPILMVPGMLRGRLSDPAALNLLDLLEQGARRGAAIIEQLLTFARETPGERKVQHLGGLVEAATRLMRETFPKNIELDVRLDAQAWPVLGDGTQLQQLILNLAMNAKDAMPGGGRLTLAVGNETVTEEIARTTPGASAGRHVVLSVVDTGHGIAAAHLGRIFDPFFTTKAFGDGSGLGLAAALGIVRRHGGFITVRSRERAGATFRVHLPALGMEEPAAEGTAAAPRPPQGEVVLVVDDEEDLRMIARQLLSMNGYSVICAKDGESALAQLKAAGHRVDLVLTDLAMPGMGGDRLIAALRRRNPGLRIIVMTGQDPAGALEGAHGCLRKPFSGEELLRALAAARAPAG